MDLIHQTIEGFSDWFLDDDALEKGKITGRLAPHDALFEPIIINGMKVKNRIIMGPMGNVNMADETGKPSAKMIAYYLERAKGGVGLITSGMVPVSMKDDPTYSEKSGASIFPRIDGQRTHYAGWRTIAEGCHAYGAKFFIQLAPGMGRVGNPECLTKKMKMPISSSWHRNWYIPEIPCKRMSDRSLKKLIQKTAQIAADCKALGIDGVYLHGHSGYLIEQMTDPAYNKRKLGRYKDVKMFGIDLVRAIRKRVGKTYPIHYRINLSAAFKATFKDKMKKESYLKRLQGERTMEETLEYMCELVKAGVDMFDVDLGGYENWWLPHPPNGMPPGAYVSMAGYVKRYFKEHSIKTNQGMPVVIVAVGKLGNPDLAEQTLRDQTSDMIMLSRPLLADPYWPKKVYMNHIKDIRPCIGDHEGCLAQLALGGHPHCAVNPRTAFEDIYGETLLTDKPKKIAVVGAGPGGVMTAITLCDRGHQVTLYDKQSRIGGMLLAGGQPKIKYEIQNYISYLEHQVNRRKIKQILNTLVGESTLIGKGYDMIILSTGSKPWLPTIKGINHSHVISGIEFLNHSEKYLDDTHYVVVGGADVGCEIAHKLSYEHNKQVTVIEMGPYFMPKTCTSNRNFMIHHLEKKQVQLLNSTRLHEIHKDHVDVKRNQSSTVPSPYVSWLPLLPDNIVNPFKKSIKEDIVIEKIKADRIIMATGMRSEDTLYEIFKKKHTATEVFHLGDAFEPGRVLEAVKAGYRLGRTL